MSETIDALDQVIIRSQTELTGRDGKMIARREYIPPLDGLSDDYEGFDMRVAEGMGIALNKHYFGYEWKTYADTKQGIVGFSIPDLMGPTLHMVIRLSEFGDLTQLVIDKGGELLERMNLPRGRFDMAAYRAAKMNRHKFQFEDAQQ